MKNKDTLEPFELRLEGKALQSALVLRVADKQLAAEAAELIEKIGGLQQELERKYVVFDELRALCFQELGRELERELTACSLKFIDAEGGAIVERTQEDLDRIASIRHAQETLTRQAVAGQAIH